MGMDRSRQVVATHIADTECFQSASPEPIPPLACEPGELIELDDELLENPTIASFFEVDNHAQNLEESPEKDNAENNEDTLIAI